MARVGGWFSFVVTLVGIWFVASPWVYGFTDNTGLMYNNIILGAVTAVFSFVAGWELVARPTEMGIHHPVT